MGQPWLKFGSDDVVNVPKVRAQRGTDISISDITTTTITWDTEIFDTAEMHNPGGPNPTRITFPTSGYYLVMLSIAWDNSTNGIRIITIKDDAGSAVVNTAIAAITGTKEVMQCFSIQYFESGDFIEATVYHSHGSALKVKKFNTSYFAAFQVR